MGSEAHVLVVGASSALLETARERIEELEQRWSRFRPDSELCRLNSGATETVDVETSDVVGLAVHLSEQTDGWFTPAVLDAVEAAGYTRSFEALTPTDVRLPVRVPPLSGLQVERGRVRLPAGLGLDLGGIGKGRAADLVATELVAAGARGACLNLGGDLRVLGEPPRPQHGWVVAVPDPWGGPAPLTTLSVTEGAVATSSQLVRSWTGGHHLIDPRTGAPSRSELVCVTVVAGSCALAEVLAKSVLLAGPQEGARLLARHDAAALLIDADHRVTRLAGIGELEPWTT